VVFRDDLAVLENKKKFLPLVGFENRISYMDRKKYLANEIRIENHLHHKILH